MKMMKLALLGGAALAVSAIGAQADDLDALKAEIEALNARVAQLEATPSVPAGYQLVTIRDGDAIVVPGNELNDKGYGSKATVISVMPTADAPSATSIEWSGYARAILGMWDDDVDTADDTYINVRGQLKVVGTTDTAVGEVGARIQLRAEGFSVGTKATWKANEVWGWWAMMPEVTLGGGYSGSLSDVGFGLDAACNCYGTDSGGIYIGSGDAEQMRLTWASGPITVAGAIQDDTGPNGDDLAFASRVNYSGDTLSGGVAGFYDNNSGIASDEYEITGGLGFALGDMASISAMAGMGQERNADDYWIASAIVSVNLSDAIHAEVGYGMQDYDSGSVSLDESNLIAGIYYDPVSQLTLGLEGEMIDVSGGGAGSIYNNVTSDAINVDFVTVFRF
jgi:opacity protein-like surface antigen